MYVASNKVTLQLVHGCMVYIELLPKQQQFQVAPAMYLLNSAVTTSVDIRHMLCKAAVTHSELRTIRAHWAYLEAFQQHKLNLQKDASCGLTYSLYFR